MMSHMWNVILYHILGIMLMTLYPNAIAYKGEQKAQSYTPKSKKNRLKSKTLTGVLQSLKEQLNRVITITTQSPNRLTKNIHKERGYSNPTGMVWHKCMEIISMQTKTQRSTGARITNFDMDSLNIGVDNRCSDCISHRVEDFEGPLIKTIKSIRGFGGSRVHNLKMGTIRWKWLVLSTSRSQ